MARQALPIEIFCSILVIIGVPANLMTLLVIYRGKCGLSKGISRDMAAKAVGGLMLLIFNLIMNEIIKHYFPHSLLKYTPVCHFSAFMQGMSIQLSIWFTMSFTFDRFIAICCQEMKLTYCMARAANVVIITVCVVNILINIPMSFRYEPYYVLNNVQWGCRTVTKYFTSLVWTAYQYITNLSSTFLPIPLLLLLNSLPAWHILVASRSCNVLKSGSNGETGSFPKLKNRRTSIIQLFTISSSFIVLSAPITVIHICDGVTHAVTFQGSNSFYLAIRATFLMMCTSSCTNTCIYALTPRRFRAEIKNMATYPHSVIIQICK